MFTLYADESGQHQDEERMFIAGYMGNQDEWNSFPEKWRKAIYPRPHLHLSSVKFKKEATRLMLARAAEVPKSCGLRPAIGGIRQRDYRDLVFGTGEEFALSGYALCVYAMVFNALRVIPEDERLEVVLERQTSHGISAGAALDVILSSDYPPFRMSDGKSKLASWRFIDKTIETEPGDYFSNALFNVWKDKNSIRSKWCKPILDAEHGRTVGKIWTRDEVREIVTVEPLRNFLPPEVRALLEAARATMGSKEFEEFTRAMQAILRADPKAVKEAIEKGKRLNAEKRKTKESSASGHADTEKD